MFHLKAPSVCILSKIRFTTDWVGDPNFSASNLTVEEKVWYDRFFAALDHTNPSVTVSGADSGDTHHYGRGLKNHLLGMLTAFRATDDLSILDRVDEFTQQMRSGLVDHFVEWDDVAQENVVIAGFIRWSDVDFGRDPIHHDG